MTPTPNRPWILAFGLLAGLCLVASGCAGPQAHEDLSLPSDKPVDVRSLIWQHLPGGVDWAMDGPGPDEAVKAGSPLRIDVYIRNRRGAPRKMPFPLYRHAAQGGLAFRQAVVDGYLGGRAICFSRADGVGGR